jgi:nucleotide-binding universal stress UspA family protein
VELAEDLGGALSVEVACTDDREPAAAIAQAATESGATICMATERAGRWGQSLLGSTAMAVVETAGRVILVGPHAQAPRSGEHRSLLVCVDGSRAAEQVLPLARAWAKDQALDLRFVQVVAPATPYPVEPSGDEDVAWTYLCGLAHGTGDATGGGGSVAVLHGDPARSIARHAKGASLVAMTTRARRGLDLAVHASTAMQVVHRSPCPVLLLKVPS